MRKKIWQPIVRALCLFMTVVIVFGAVINSKLEAEAADTFLGIQNLISEVSNGYQESQDKYTILEIVPDRSASEIGYLFDGYEPALSVWDETAMRWKGWKEQLGECADEAARRLLIEGDGTEGSGLKAKLQTYYDAQGITNGPVAYSGEAYAESSDAQEGYELIEFSANKKTGWFEPLDIEGPGYDVTFGVKVYDSTKINTAYYGFIAESMELITNENNADIPDEDVVYIKNTDAEGNVAYYPFYWSEVKERFNDANPPECYFIKFEKVYDYDSLTEGQYIYTADRITRSDMGKYSFAEGTFDEGGQLYVLGAEGVYVKNTFTNNNWLHRYVLGMTPEEYGTFPVEVLSYTPEELEIALANGAFPKFDFLYINSGKSTDDKNTDDYEGWIYSSGYDAANKKGEDISQAVGAHLFNTVQNNLLPCFVDGNIIFSQDSDDSSLVSQNEDLMDDAPEMFKLCAALCQNSLDGMDYASYTSEDDLYDLWDGLAEGAENGHFATDHVYCHTGEDSILDEGFGTELIYTGDGAVPLAFGKVLDEIKLENLYRQSDVSGEYPMLSTDISRAVVVRHIMNYKNRRNVQPKEHISVLEIQPAKTEGGKPELTIDQIRIWAPEVNTADITVMTTAEFIGKVENLNDKYDLIYIGTNKDHMNTEKRTENQTAPERTVFNDSDMDGLIYYNIGDMRYAGMELSGQLDTEYYQNNRANNVFFYIPTRYGGNDITMDKMNALLSYLNGSYPVVVSDEFFESPVTIYPHDNYVGYAAYFDVGEYDTAKLMAQGLDNDDANAIKVREGYRLYAYSSDDFEGKEGVWENTEIEALEEDGFGKNSMSSLIVEAIEGITPENKINKEHIDDSSYMYEFANTALNTGYGNFYRFSDIGEDSELFQYYLNRPKVKLANTFVNGSKSANHDEVYLLQDVNGVYTLEYRFTIVNEGAASTDTRYQCRLYIDANSDGKFSTQEIMDDITVSNNGSVISANQLYGGSEYVLQRAVPDGYKGVLPWRVEISQVNNTNIYCAMEGYTKLVGLEPETINIIQISRDQILYGQYEWPNPDEEFFSLAEEINGKKTIYEDLETITVREDGKRVTHVTKSWAYSSDTAKIDGYEDNLYYVLVHGGTYNGVKYKGVDDEFDINVDFYTISKFEDELANGNIDMSEYNMLVMGFTDIYGEFSGTPEDATSPLGVITAFINSGKSVLMSHDNTSFFNYEKGKSGITDRSKPTTSLASDGQFHNAYTMNKYIRGLVGMDRYGILEPGISGILQAGNALTSGSDAWNAVAASGKDMAYKPKSGRTETVPEVQGYTYSIINARDKNERVEDFDDAKVYTQAETGLSEEWINEYLNTVYGTVYYADEGDSNVPDWVVPSDEGEVPEGYDGAVFDLWVTQVNRGQITEYPYKLADTFPVSTTHAQYYQLDFTDDDDNDGQSDLVVWYCLGPRLSKKTGEFQETIYSMSPNDVANNYYIYTKGNITYSGVGHAGIESADMVDEAKLFINTMIMAYKAGIKPPSITIQESAEYGSSQLKVLYRYFDDDFALDEVDNSTGEYENIYFKVRDDNFVKGTRNLTLRAFYEAKDGDKNIIIKNENITVKELEREGKIFDAATGQNVHPDRLQSGGIYYIKVPKDVLASCDDSGMQIYLETQSIITSDNRVVETDKTYAKLEVMKVYLFELN